MFVQLFIVVVISICWCLGGGMGTLLVFCSSAWLAFCPPRSLLKGLERLSKGQVRFYFPELPQHAEQGKLNAILTVDDCPSYFIGSILDAIPLEQKAYFGIIGNEANRYPDTMRILQTSRHGLFNHDHFNRATALLSENQIRLGLNACVGSVKSGRLEFFRPGCGLVSPATLQVAKEFGYTTLLGDCYMHDCMLAWLPASWLAWMYRKRITHGSVVILHGGTERQCKNTAAVIRSLCASGVEFVALPRTT